MTTTPNPVRNVRFEIHRSDSPVPADRRAQLVADPGFGQVFTDHMITIRWSAEQGWHDAQLRPYGPLQLDPATAVLHYSQSIFEGFKAYHQDSGGVKTFRPDANARRFNRSAARLALPALPEEIFVEAADLLIQNDREWVPTAEEHSLYIRPFMFATEVFLGVRPAREYLFIVLASPAGAYFAKGVKPVSVWLSEDYVRAAPGGTGEAKCGGNYAASLVAQQQAADNGCDQVVWLDAAEHRQVEEMGGMNLFFVYGSEEREVTLVTPELTGTLLPGVTRDSLLTLGREMGYKVEERRVSVDEWRRDLGSGNLTEAFACGTAAVITPVGEVKSATGGFVVRDGQPGPITMKLRRMLLDIQHGRVPDQHGWLHAVV
ncbi:MAG: branched-chain amino acid aminotransferase [Streptosporangiales bacterium]|nr:branched-chain amino acid aminotransferase [Streptosporangiales bacterium]